MPGHKQEKFEFVSTDGRKTAYIRKQSKHANPESSSKPVERASRDRDAKRRDNDILKTVAKPDTETFVRLAAENPNNTYTRYKIGEKISPSGGVEKRTEDAETFKAAKTPARRHDTFDTATRNYEVRTHHPKKSHTVSEAAFRIIDADPSLRFSKSEGFPESRRDSQHERTESYSNAQWGDEIKRSTSPEWDSDIERPISPDRSSEQDHFTSSRKSSDPDKNIRSRSFPEQDKGTKSYPLHRNLFAEVAEVKEQTKTTFEQPQRTPVEKTSSSRSSEQAREKQSPSRHDIFTRDDGTSRSANLERSRPTLDRVENKASSTFPKQDKGTRSYPRHDIFTRDDGTPRSANLERSRPTPDPVENITPRTFPEPIKTDTQPRRRDTAPPKTDTQPQRSNTELPKPDIPPKRSNTESWTYSETGRPSASRGFAPEEAGQKPAAASTEQEIFYTVGVIKGLDNHKKLDFVKNLGPERLGKLGPTRIEALGNVVLQQLSSEERKGIAKGLDVKAIGQLKPQTINNLGPTLIKDLGPKKAQTLVENLDPRRLGIMGDNKLGRLSNEVIKQLAQELGPGMVKHLGNDVAHMLDSDMIKSLGSKGAQVVAKDIGPYRMEELYSGIVQQLAQTIGPEGAGILRRPEGQGGLGTQIIGTLTTPDAKKVMRELGPTGIAKLNPDARGDLIGKITPEDLQNLIKELGSEKIRQLGHTWLKTLGTDVAKEVHAAFPDLLKKISDDEEERNPRYKRYMDRIREQKEYEAQYQQRYEEFFRDYQQDRTRRERDYQQRHPRRERDYQQGRSRWESGY